MLTILLLIGAAHAACDTPTSAADIAAAAPKAQIAFASMDEAGFHSAVSLSRAALPCLARPLSPLDAAAYHGTEALALFYEGRADEATLALASANAALPGYQLPALIAPPGGDLDQLLARARAIQPGDAQALPPADGVLYVDGAQAIVRPAWRPVVLQVVARDGSVRANYYLRPGDPLPAWDPPPTFAQAILPEPRKRPSGALGAAAGASALAAGGLYLLAADAHARFDDPATPYGDLAGLQTQNNAALGGAIALSAATVALGTLTFLRW